MLQILEGVYFDLGHAASYADLECSVVFVSTSQPVLCHYILTSHGLVSPCP